jgi:hypothetical protein
MLIAPGVRAVIRDPEGRVFLQRRGDFGIYTGPAYGVTYPNGDQIRPFTVAFLVEEWGGTPTGDGAETLELGFFALDDLPPEETIHPPHRKVLCDIRAFPANGTLIGD